jgi:hypothetical protein
MVLTRIFLTWIILGWVILWRNFLPRRDFPGRALHPLRRARTGSSSVRIRRGLGLILFALEAARLHLLIGATHCRKRIGLPDQPRKFSQRIAVGLCRRARITATIIIVVRRKRSILISISHRDDASPSGKKAASRLLYKRTGPCQKPPQVPV